MHVFLSYARDDKAIVEPLTTVLGAHGIRLWLDTAGLPPGSPQWHHMIRRAIQAADGVIAICSDKTRDSEYMAIELEIAKGYRKTIIPVWVSGDNWPLSSPVALVLSQYIDLRRTERPNGIVDLLNAQKAHLAQISTREDTSNDKWPLVKVEWNERYHYVNPFSYRDWGELLSEVYLSLVEGTFSPFSYGETWALEISGRGDRHSGWPIFALPASWAKVPFRGVHEVDLEWVHSTPLELLSINQSENDRDGRRYLASPDQLVRSRARIIDLRALKNNPQGMHKLNRWDESAESFIGSRCRCRTFWTFATGDHPKVTLMHLSSQGRTNDLCMEAFSCFSQPEPKFQVATLSNSYFSKILTGQLPATFARLDSETRIVDFN